MSDYIDTREGWRETTVDEFVTAPTDRFTGYFGGVARYFVREEPVPPLPTEPYTVIHVEWRDPQYLTGSHVYTRTSDGWWVPQNRNAPMSRPGDLHAQCSSFEVLSEPRHVTAKAVLDRVATTSMYDGNWDEGMHQVAREFGVDQ